MTKAVFAERESDLYEPVLRYLNTEFYQLLKPRLGSLLLVADIVDQVRGGEDGRWTRPDLIAAVLTRHKYSPSPRLDILSFEVKTKVGAEIPSVHQALAHAQYVNASYLVWNWPNDGTEAVVYRSILRACQDHGVGLILAHDPGDPTSFRIKSRPRHADRDPDIIDRFIEERFSPDNRDRITAGIAALMPRGKT